MSVTALLLMLASHPIELGASGLRRSGGVRVRRPASRSGRSYVPPSAASAWLKGLARRLSKASPGSGELSPKLDVAVVGVTSSPAAATPSPGELPTSAPPPPAAVPVSAAQTDEAAGYKKRAEESAAAGVAPLARPPRGGDPLPSGPGWAWSLNWDPVLLRPDGSVEVYVGSCPRSAADVERLADAGVQALLCLQSDDCFAALGIDGEAVRSAAARRGVLWLRVAVRDFDRLDQAAMLPDIVRALGALTAMGKRTYVHCTAGINRAPLAVVGLLTFARGWGIDDAVAHVKAQRGQANPYVEPWRVARARLLAGREEELHLRAVAAGDSRAAGGDWVARDWAAAQAALLADTFARRAAVDVNLAEAAAATAKV